MKKKKITMNLIKSYIDPLKFGIIFQWDQKIVPVNQVWLLNQVLLNQKKTNIVKTYKNLEPRYTGC